MEGFTVVNDSVVTELKNLKTEIESIKVLATMCLKLTPEEAAKIRKCENRILEIIENL